MIQIAVKTFQLILPVMVPSWRFFDTIAPSPRVEYALFDASDHDITGWQEFWPRPQHVSLLRMLRRMIYNPCWNESLYVTACAERLIKLHDEGTQTHSAEQIAQRIRESIDSDDAFRFRLVFASRDGAQVVRHVLHLSDRFEKAVP